MHLNKEESTEKSDLGDFVGDSVNNLLSNENLINDWDQAGSGKATDCVHGIQELSTILTSQPPHN